MFKYRVVFFKQKSCPACSAMSPIWNEVSSEIHEEYPYLNVGFGEWDVLSDNWEFADSLGVDGTPNFAVFGEEAELLGLNTDGMLTKTELKNFILGCANAQ
jgi:hypothetical protein